MKLPNVLVSLFIEILFRQPTILYYRRTTAKTGASCSVRIPQLSALVDMIQTVYGDGIEALYFPLVTVIIN